MEDSLIDRFEKMQESNEFVFFDSFELTDIATYYLDSYDFDYAKKAIDLGLQQFPENTEFKIKLLEYCVGVEDLPQAYILIEELKDSSDEDIDYLLSSAKYWSLRKLHSNAIVLYKKALDLHEERDYIYNCIGSEYTELEEYNQALVWFKRALQTYKNEDGDLDDFALSSVVYCYEKLGKVKPCITFLEKLLQENPYSEILWYQLGFQFLNTQEYRKAASAFDYVLIVNPNSIAGYMQKAYAYEKLDRYDKAIEVYKESLHIDDATSFTFLKIGQAYNKLKNEKEALTYLKKSVKEDPQFDKAWAELADIYENLFDYKLALECIYKAVSLNGSEVSYWRRNAYLNLKINNVADVIESFKMMVELDSTDYFNWLSYAELLISIEEYEEAITVLTKAVDIIPDKAELYYQLSNCYFVLDQEEKGEKNLDMALLLGKSIQDDMANRYPILKEKILKRL